MAAKHTTLEKPVRRAPGSLNLERVCQAVVLLVGARAAYAGRNLPIGADGLAYLDVARSYVRHDWQTAVNGYWGPLYAWLLAIAMRIFRPGIHYEFAVVRALNFVIFALALYTFSKFWRAVGDWSRRSRIDGTSLPECGTAAWTFFGYLLFLVNFVWSVEVVNPDILVAAIVFAIAAALFTLDGSSLNQVGAYARLGVLLAVGYYAKAILLYFAIFVLGAVVLRGVRGRQLRGPLTAILVFGVLVAPFVLLLSRTIGHVTAGDSGKLNYAWFVNGPETKSWEKDAAGGAPLPFYPGPVIFDSPRVFFDPSIDGVTYAPWYDATRFDKRSRPKLSLRDQMRQLAVNLRYCREQLLGEGATLTVPLLIVAFFSPKESWRRFRATWFCTLPAAGVFGMYLLVHLVERFVIGFSLLFWGAAWASVIVPDGFELQARRAMQIGTIVFAAYTIPGLLHYVISPGTGSVAPDMAIADTIPAYGLRPGDLVGVVGDGQEAYWAHFAQLSVVAEIWRIDTAQFWSADPLLRQSALHSIAETGAKAVVSRGDSKHTCPAGWQSLAGGSGCIMLLR